MHHIAISTTVHTLDCPERGGTTEGASLTSGVWATQDEASSPMEGLIAKLRMKMIIEAHPCRAHLKVH